MKKRKYNNEIFKWKATPFLREDYNEQKYIDENKKKTSTEPLDQY